MSKRFCHCLAGRGMALAPASILRTAQLCRILVRSPGPAPQEAGMQPRLSYKGSLEAGSWCTETCTKVARSNLGIQDTTGPFPPALLHWQKSSGWTLETRIGKYSRNKGREMRVCACSTIPDRSEVEVKSFLMISNKPLTHEYCG